MLKWLMLVCRADIRLSWLFKCLPIVLIRTAARQQKLPKIEMMTYREKVINRITVSRGGLKRLQETAFGRLSTFALKLCESKLWMSH